METYSDDEVDAAIERIAGDVARRSAHPEFPGAAMAAVVDQLRRMEGARRGGEVAAAVLFAAAAQPALDAYRPTNATSRSKALLVEVVGGLLAANAAPDN